MNKCFYSTLIIAFMIINISCKQKQVKENAIIVEGKTTAPPAGVPVRQSAGFIRLLQAKKQFKRPLC